MYLGRDSEALLRVCWCRALTVEAMAGRERYPGEPFVGVCGVEGRSYLHIGTVAMGKLDWRAGEWMLALRIGGTFYVRLCEEGYVRGAMVRLTDYGYGRVNLRVGEFEGLLPGDYMLGDAVHVNGYDLFELVGVEEWYRRRDEE